MTSAVYLCTYSFYWLNYGIILLNVSLNAMEGKYSCVELNIHLVEKTSNQVNKFP